MYSIKGKVVLITGAASGVGLGCLMAFLNEGAKHCIGLDINEAKFESLEDELNLKYGNKKVKFIYCDVAKNFQAIYDQIWNEYGYINVLVNNAGVIRETLDCVDLAVGVNMAAVLKGSLLAFKSMNKRNGGSGGTVINIASMAGLETVPSLSIYSATKSGIIKFSACIGAKFNFETSGVRVICACLGPTITSILDVERPQDLFLNQESFDATCTIENLVLQSSEDAGEGVADVFKKAESGSIWTVFYGKATNITEVFNASTNLIVKAVNNIYPSQL